MPPDPTDELRQRLLATFRLEAAEHLATMGAIIQAFAEEPAPADLAARLESLFRTMHTLKGAARSVGLDPVEERCQAGEVLLRRLTTEGRAPDAATLAHLQESTDAIARLLAGEVAPAQGPARVASPAAPPRPAPEPRQRTAAPVQAEHLGTVRVEVDRLDRLSRLSEELLVPKLGLGEGVREAKALEEEIRRIRNGLRRSGGGPTPNADPFAPIEARMRHLAATLAAEHKRLRLAADGFAEEVRNIRMTPAAAILEAFPLMVRDLARSTGKEVAWRVRGADVTVDRQVLEVIKDPLIHIVRNAIDHGIEPPTERIESDKPRGGTVTLAVERREGGRVLIEVSDDGRGFDRAAVAKAAVRARSLAPEAAGALADQAVLDLAFRPGVSTSPVISAISGNGVGLAVVRERVESVGGRITLESEPGRGSVIRLDLPVSIATHRGLLLAVAGTLVLWPDEAVERTVGVPHAAAVEGLRRGMIIHDGAALPFARLAAIIGLGGRLADAEHGRHPAIIATVGSHRAILVCDAVLGDREIVVKPFSPPLQRVAHFAAAGLLADGSLALIARPSDVLRSIRAEGDAPATAAAADQPARADRRRRILVVDDSITTRTMERNLLESAGYAVRTAADGADAIQMLREEAVDLVLSDVDMPRMDGFELTQRIRADQALAALPVVLVTALETREDKARGVQVGANAYVLKSAFDQSNLIEIVRRLT